MIDKVKLKKLVNDRDIRISMEKLEQAMVIYTNLINYYMKDKYKEYLFLFIKENIKSSDYQIAAYHREIFILIVQMLKGNLLMYTDYILIDIEARAGRDHVPSDLHYLRSYLYKVVNFYNDRRRKYKGEMRVNTHRIINDNLDQFIKKYQKNEKVPQYYIDIMTAFYQAYVTCYSINNKSYSFDEVSFNDFLEDTYFYLIEKNLLHTEPESVLSFVSSLIGNEDYFLDKMCLAGFSDEIDFENDRVIKYIDTLYNNSKIKKINIR